MNGTDALVAVRAAILRIIDLNPHNYQSLASYQHALRREKALVQAEVDAGRRA